MSIKETIIEVNFGIENFTAVICLIKNEDYPGTFGTFLPIGWIPKEKKGIVHSWEKLGDVGGPPDQPHQWWSGLQAKDLQDE